MLRHLCEVAVDELRMSGAVVSLMTPVSTRRDQSGTFAAASSEQARAVDELEFSVGEGPGKDAFLTSRPVLTGDLEHAFDRWPGYVPAALAAGVRATFAFPLLVGAARFGVLHLHSPRVRTLTTREIAISLLLTELAMEIVLRSENSRLVLRRTGAPDIVFSRVTRDVFASSDQTTLNIERDSFGTVSSFLLSTSRVRNLRFLKTTGIVGTFGASY